MVVNWNNGSYRALTTDRVGDVELTTPNGEHITFQNILDTNNEKED